MSNDPSLDDLSRQIGLGGSEPSRGTVRLGKGSPTEAAHFLLGASGNAILAPSDPAAARQSWLTPVRVAGIVAGLLLVGFVGMMAVVAVGERAGRATSRPAVSTMVPAGGEAAGSGVGASAGARSSASADADAGASSAAAGGDTAATARFVADGVAFDPLRVKAAVRDLRALVPKDATFYELTVLAKGPAYAYVDRHGKKLRYTVGSRRPERLKDASYLAYQDPIDPATLDASGPLALVTTVDQDHPDASSVGWSGVTLSATKGLSPHTAWQAARISDPVTYWNADEHGQNPTKLPY